MIWLNPQDRLKAEKGVRNEENTVNVKETAEEKYTVKELKAMCKERGIKNYSKLKEAELIEILGL